MNQLSAGAATARPRKESSRIAKLFAHGALAVLALGTAVSTAGADPIEVRVITFDDVNALLEPPVPNGYAGLSWSSFQLMDKALEPGIPDYSGYGHARISPPNVAFNGFGDPAAFGSKTPFNFISAFFAPAWRDNLQVTVEGFTGGQLKYSQTLTLPRTIDPTFATFGFLNVDRVRFESSGGTPVTTLADGAQFGMDDVTIAAAPSPEPASLLLLVTGFAAAALRRRSFPRGPA